MFDVGARIVACFSITLCITTSDFDASEQFQHHLSVPKGIDHRYLSPERAPKDACLAKAWFSSPHAL
jgi:hypothetical protein